MVSEEGSVLPGAQVESGNRQEVQAAEREGQRLVGEVGQQAGCVLQKFYAAGISGALAVVWLTLSARLVVV